MKDKKLDLLIQEEVEKVLSEFTIGGGDDGGEIDALDDYDKKFGAFSYVEEMKKNIVDTMHFVLERTRRSPFRCTDRIKRRRNVELERTFSTGGRRNKIKGYPGQIGFHLLDSEKAKNLFSILETAAEKETGATRQNRYHESKAFKLLKRTIYSIVDKLFDGEVKEDTFLLWIAKESVYCQFSTDKFSYCKMYYRYTQQNKVRQRSKEIRKFYNDEVRLADQNREQRFKQFRKKVHAFTIEGLIQSDLDKVENIIEKAIIKDSRYKKQKAKTAKQAPPPAAKQAAAPAAKQAAEAPAKTTAPAARQTVEVPKYIQNLYNNGELPSTIGRQFRAIKKAKIGFIPGIDALAPWVSLVYKNMISKIKEESSNISYLEKYLINEQQTSVSQQQIKYSKETIAMIYKIQRKLRLPDCAKGKKIDCADGIYGLGTHKAVMATGFGKKALQQVQAAESATAKPEQAAATNQSGKEQPKYMPSTKGRQQIKVEKSETTKAQDGRNIYTYIATHGDKTVEIKSPLPGELGEALAQEIFCQKHKTKDLCDIVPAKKQG